MRVSIITMTSTYNYGATLQAFALQEYIEQLGHSCEIIDHMRVCDAKHRTVSVTDFSKGNLLKIPYKRSLEQGYANFELFYKEYMHMGRRYADDNELYNDPPDYDVYITGSDQVWNPRDFKEKFFLTFAKPGAKRISYAASIGVSALPEEKKTIFAKYLNNIDAISVREVQGKKMIEELTDKPVSVNCDPIFLLDREIWRAIENPVDEIDDEYILCYMIYKPDWFNSWIKTVKKKTQKKIVFVGLNGFRTVMNDKFVRSAGPREFLWLIDHAASVVTSSFHGTAFSIMFGKPLVAIPDPPRPDRIRNLLGMFDLASCELGNNNSEIGFEPYDDNLVKKRLSVMRSQSHEYLTNAIE